MTNLDITPESPLLDRLKGWHRESVQWEARWRPDAYEDEAFVHNHQWTAEERRELEASGRLPMNFNHIQKTIWAMAGFRAQNKLDLRYLPRGDSDNGIAEARTELAKFVFDTNHVEFRSQKATLAQYIGPMGWLFAGYQHEDPHKEPISIRDVSWKEMRLDPKGKEDDLSDSRFLIRERWMTLEDAQLLYPEKKDELAGQVEMRRDDTRTPSHEVAGDQYGHVVEWAHQTPMYVSWQTKEVRIIECWYRKKEWGHYLVQPDGTVIAFDQNSQEHQMAAMTGGMIKPGIFNNVYYATFIGDILLEQGTSPYSHGYFPYVPLWGVRDENGYPYGVVRVLKDPQRVINWSMSKLQWIAAARQVIMEEGAADEAQVADNAARPDGIIKVRAGKRFEIINQNDIAALDASLLQNAINDIKEMAGSPEELRGQASNATSGRAIAFRQEAGLRQQGIYLDQEQRAMVQIGEMVGSMFADTYSNEKILRITEADGKPGFVAINVMDPLKKQELQARGIKAYGDVNQGHYDTVVTTQPMHASVKLAQLDELGQFMQSISPQLRDGVADLYIRATSVPFKDEMAQRFQAITAGMYAQGMPPGGPPPGNLPEPPPPQQAMEPSTMVNEPSMTERGVA